MNRSESEQILRKTAYWHYPVDLPWGRMTASKPGHNERHEWRRRHFFTRLLERCGGTLSGRRVLDLACCQGFWSFEAARNGAQRCLGLDSSAAFTNEAQAIKILTGTSVCEFRCVHLEEDPWWAELEQFDVTLFLGLFYHLTDAVSVLRRALALTREIVVIDTEISADERPTLTIVPRDPQEPTTSGSNPVAPVRLVPSRAAISTLLRCCRFSQVEFLAADRAAPDDYRLGKRVSVIARRDKARPAARSDAS